MSKFTSLVKNTRWYFGANTLGSILSLVLVPLYTNYLSPGDYGIIAIIMLITNLVSCFSTFGLEYFCNRVIIRFRDDSKKLQLLLGNIYLVIIILMVLTSLVLSLFTNFFYNYFFDENTNLTASIILLPIWLSFFQRIVKVGNHYLIYTSQGNKYFSFNSSQIILLHTIKVIALIIYKAGVIGFLFAELFVQIILSLSYIIYLKKNLNPKIIIGKKNILKLGFRYSFPFIFQNFSTWTMQYVDRIFLLKLLNMWSIGLYSFSLAMSRMLVEGLWGAVDRGVLPEIANRLDSKSTLRSSEKYIIEYVLIFSIFSSFAGLVICLFSKELLLLVVNDRFQESYLTIPFFILALIFEKIKSFFYIPVQLKLKTWFYVFNSFCGAILNIILCNSLIPIYGIIGAAISITISSLLITLMALYYAQKLIFINYNYFLTIFPLLTAIILFIPKIFFEFSIIGAFTLNLTISIISFIISTILVKRYCPRTWIEILKIKKKFFFS